MRDEGLPIGWARRPAFPSAGSRSAHGGRVAGWARASSGSGVVGFSVRRDASLGAILNVSFPLGARLLSGGVNRRANNATCRSGAEGCLLSVALESFVRHSGVERVIRLSHQRQQVATLGEELRADCSSSRVVPFDRE